MAISLKTLTPLSDSELLELSKRNPGYQFERTAKGELIVTPTGGEAGRRNARLTQQLANWTDRHGRGVAFDSSTGFDLPDGSTFAPDASWMRRERWDALSRDERRRFAPLCPDAAFEIRSENQSLAELREKMRTYMANGAQVAVLIDPYQRAVEVYRPQHEPEKHTGSQAVTLDPEMPGFSLDIAPFFEP
jgi:Uma2 family endonuclease